MLAFSFLFYLKKLDAIEKLKEQQTLGKALEVNQIAKIKGEADLIKELEHLQM
jgi:translation initiation factor 2A